MSSKHRSTLRFDLNDAGASSPRSTFGPRLGKVSFHRHDDEDIVLDILTPGLIASTSRGVVPHLSRDNTNATEAIRWAHVPFESFLEHTPTVPTLQPGDHPLHKFLGFRPNKHILSMSLRDPSDDREMPANGTSFVTSYCLRGVRKVSPADWRNHVLATVPDVVTALSDIPFTSVGHSQKRTTKRLERSAAWLSTLLTPLTDPSTSMNPGAYSPRLNVFVHMAGGAAVAARKAFSLSLLETLYGKEAAAIQPFTTLDEGVSGYTFDLVPLHRTVSPTPPPTQPTHPPTLKATMSALDLHPNIISPQATTRLIPLLHASLEPLPHTKPRIAHSASSPHEMLTLVRDVGIDLFDAHWAQRAADIGVALDFVFPVPQEASCNHKSMGHNLYDEQYAHDFSPFADTFRSCVDGETDREDKPDPRPACPCIACAPARLAVPLRHSTADEPLQAHAPAPFTRAYVHHLLHTHEMSAHAFLAAHNLSVLDAFFAGVRAVLATRPEAFAIEVERFAVAYDGEMGIWTEARRAWAEVALARGKGRLAREKEKKGEDTLGTAVEL